MFRVQDLGFGGLGLRVWGVGFIGVFLICGPRFRVNLECRVEGSGV